MFTPDALKACGKRALPWVVGIVIFAVVSLRFFSPQFDGKSLGQGDIAQYAGMSQVMEANTFAFRALQNELHLAVNRMRISWGVFRFHRRWKNPF